MISPVLDSVLRGIRTVLLGNGASKLFLISFEFFIAGLMGPAFFGLYSIALSLAQIVAYLCLMGLNFAAVQYLSKYEGDTDRCSSVIIFSLAAVAAAGLVAGAIFAGCSDLISEKIFHKPELDQGLLLAAPVVFFDAVNQQISSIFRGLRQYKNSLAAYDMLRNFFCLAGLPLLYVFRASLSEVMLMCVIAGAIGTGYGVFALAKQGLLSLKFKPVPSVCRELITFSKPLFVWNLLLVFVVRPYVVSGVFLSAADTGIFALGAKVALGFIFFQTAVNSAALPEFAKFHHEKNMPAQQDLYQSVSQGLLAVVSALGIAVFINPNVVLGFISKDYAPYGWVLLPMLFAHFLNAVMGPAGHLLIANDKPRLVIGLTVFDMVALFGVFVPLTYFFGLAGAVAGETIRLISYVILRLWLVYKHLGIHFFGRSYLRIAILALVCTGLGMAMTFSGVGYFVAMPVALLLYGIGGIGVLMTDPRMQHEIRAILKF